MSNDQPTYKVTDRRLFNADGSPRELSPEEVPEPKPETAAANVANVEAAATTEQPPAEAAASSGQTATSPTAAPEEAVHDARDALGAEDELSEFTEEELADARDPAGFLSFIMSIASNAASALGMMEHPVTHQRDVDVELGKHWIDVLGMLQKKTEGNLSPKEKQMLEGLLADLRMQYVSLVNTPIRAPRFSGTDITGGR
jgi:hypothetical protein